MPRLIVNADDYGMTAGVNRSVGELYAAGVLTSATLMAAAPRAAEAASFSRANPGLGVGCHIVLVDGSPVATAAEAGSLRQPGSEKLYGTLNNFLRALWRGQIREDDIEFEAAAQIARLQAMGVMVDHIDTHKHTHMFPQVLAPVLRAARACGVGAVRNPFEPAWSARRTRHGGFVRGVQVGALRARFRRPFLQAVFESGFVTTDGAIGVLATGVLTEKILTRLLRNLPEGTWELVCHPGHADAELQLAATRLRGSRMTEHAALLAAVKPSQHPLTSFGHLLNTA